MHTPCWVSTRHIGSTPNRDLSSVMSRVTTGEPFNPAPLLLRPLPRVPRRVSRRGPHPAV